MIHCYCFFLSRVFGRPRSRRALSQKERCQVPSPSPPGEGWGEGTRKSKIASGSSQGASRHAAHGLVMSRKSASPGAFEGDRPLQRQFDSTSIPSPASAAARARSVPGSASGCAGRARGSARAAPPVSDRTRRPRTSRSAAEGRRSSRCRHGARPARSYSWRTTRGAALPPFPRSDSPPRRSRAAGESLSHVRSPLREVPPSAPPECRRSDRPCRR